MCVCVCVCVCVCGVANCTPREIILVCKQVLLYSYLATFGSWIKADKSSGTCTYDSDLLTLTTSNTVEYLRSVLEKYT